MARLAQMATSRYWRAFDRGTTSFVVKNTYRNKYNRYIVTDDIYDNTTYDVNNTLKLRTQGIALMTSLCQYETKLMTKTKKQKRKAAPINLACFSFSPDGENENNP